MSSGVGQNGSVSECRSYLLDFYYRHYRQMASFHGDKRLKHQLEDALFSAPAGHRQDPPPFYNGQEYDTLDKDFILKSVGWEPSASAERPISPETDSREWMAWRCHQGSQEQQNCRQVLNQHYQTDNFVDEFEDPNSIYPGEHASQQPPPPALAPQCLDHVRPSTTQHHHAPTGPNVIPPSCPSGRYGEAPNPRPWESGKRRQPTPRRGVYVGYQPDLIPLKPAYHSKKWDNETRLPYQTCPLWHCRLPHKRSNSDRPW